MADALRRRRRLHLHPRQLRVNAGPMWRAGCPDGHRRGGEIWIIEGADPNEDQVWSCLRLAKERSTAIPAEPTVHSIAAVRNARKVARLSRNLERRRAKARANRSAACAQVLTVPAPAHARNDRRLQAFPANRTAEASSSHCHRSLQGQSGKGPAQEIVPSAPTPPWRCRLTLRSTPTCYGWLRQASARG